MVRSHPFPTSVRGATAGSSRGGRAARAVPPPTNRPPSARAWWATIREHEVTDMPSRFPGMDPYLESPRYWRDFHHAFLTYLRDALQPALRPRYHAAMDERLYVETTNRSVYPDVTVSIRPIPLLREPSPAYSAALAFSLPVVLEDLSAVEDDPVREPTVEIRTTGDDTLVTVIELLSPANKAASGEGRIAYRRKQFEIRNSSAHLVEIDLLRSGEHTVAASERLLERVAPFDYLASVVRQPANLRYELYPISLAEPLPDLLIPLLPDDPDVRLPLQACLDRAYDNGAYADRIDYAKPPDPPLTPAQSERLSAVLG
ncbi:MAG: hypothetical protein COZ06_00815 [Armatimonadetes bacterium CG_4_10_14_3_um_filter_66_18]|nr:MAG: hypothetical protein COS65_16785 [Armatimonadetes bacterium CG06_land_8_20_14_3_00_66_21]PIY53999.1 MAG: hypothetical protein COZ06_00815 [Armatimonadetes bacterium CG_4_10_14_3_um_filter_66_18]